MSSLDELIAQNAATPVTTPDGQVGLAASLLWALAEQHNSETHPAVEAASLIDALADRASAFVWSTLETSGYAQRSPVMDALTRLARAASEASDHWRTPVGHAVGNFVRTLMYEPESEQEIDLALDWLADLAAHGGEVGQECAASALLLVDAARWKKRRLADGG